MKIRWFRSGFYFSFTFLSFLIAILIVILLLTLACWQLHRADYKKQLLEQFQHREINPLLTLDELPTQLNAVLYRRLEVRGHFDPAHQFLIMNQFWNHQLGYHVITPFIVDDQTKVLLIHRGWIPQKNSGDIPQIPTSQETITLTGIIDIPPSKRFILGENFLDTNSWPMLIQKIDFAKISGLLNNPVYSFILRMETNSENAFKTDWQPVVMPPSRHIAYALQWLGLAIVFIIGFITLNMQKRK